MYKKEISNEEYKSCENCYYEEFDEYAYPCAMCIRGYTRKDKWQPKRSLSQNEPLDCLKCAKRGRCGRGRTVDCPLRKRG